MAFTFPTINTLNRREMGCSLIILLLSSEKGKFNPFSFLQNNQQAVSFPVYQLSANLAFDLISSKYSWYQETTLVPWYVFFFSQTSCFFLLTKDIYYLTLKYSGNKLRRMRGQHFMLELVLFVLLSHLDFSQWRKTRTE